MSLETQLAPRPFVVTVALSPADAGLFTAVAHAKGTTNDETATFCVSFCLQLLASELPSLSAGRSLQDDLEHVLLNLSAEKKRGSLLLAGAEKILREAAALREQVARQTATRP
jgi:hypothetical protein